ncbi:MAG: hypothetical protein K2H89_09925 [Oscillospiraceae bacterium]|nr:hypothetical protein [Oscillospiraceae bacterium]
MRYIEIKLLEEIETGRDMLGNPIKELHEICRAYSARISGISATETALDGRDVTESCPELLTDVPLHLLRKAAGIRIHAQDFRITSIYEKIRGDFSLVQLERWHNQHENHHCT